MRKDNEAVIKGRDIEIRMSAHNMPDNSSEVYIELLRLNGEQFAGFNVDLDVLIEVLEILKMNTREF